MKSLLRRTLSTVLFWCYRTSKVVGFFTAMGNSCGEDCHWTSLQFGLAYSLLPAKTINDKFLSVFKVDTPGKTQRHIPLCLGFPSGESHSLPNNVKHTMHISILNCLCNNVAGCQLVPVMCQITQPHKMSNMPRCVFHLFVILGFLLKVSMTHA